MFVNWFIQKYPYPFRWDMYMLFLKRFCDVWFVTLFVTLSVFAQENTFFWDDGAVPIGWIQQAWEDFSRETFLMQYTLDQPTQYPQVTRDGRFVPSSIESYSVWARHIQACSFIARHNINMLLDAMGRGGQWVAQGDAHDLIRFGLLGHKFLEFTDKNRLISTLDNRFKNQLETVFDIYRYVSNRSYALQSHRVAVFLWDDNNWYVLDPDDGKRTRIPQLFSEYLRNDVEWATWYIRVPGYTSVDPLSVDQFESTLPYLSPELRAFFQVNYFDTPHVLAPDMLNFVQDVSGRSVEEAQ